MLILLMNVSYFLSSLSPSLPIPLFAGDGLTGWIDEREKGKFQDLHRSIKVCLRDLRDATPWDMNVYVDSLNM